MFVECQLWALSDVASPSLGGLWLKAGRMPYVSDHVFAFVFKQMPATQTACLGVLRPLGPNTDWSSAGPSSGPSLAQDTVEVLLLRLKPDTQYKTTVYPELLTVEGQPQATEFKTSMWSL